MTEVISVKFKNNGKVYFFDPNGVTAEKGQAVVVETSKGAEFAECAEGNHQVDDASVVPPLRPVLRVATEADKKCAEENRRKEAEAFRICQEKIEKHGIEMKLVDAEYSFDGSKILFFFTSDGRVDFRELVKDLASVFRTRIELRQIGIRDEARMLGGLGICGKPFCCAQFLDDFQPVSIKMAKTQGLSLNPTKISGTCGRLMCCLKYEQEAYEELVKNVPKMDAFVQTPAGKGSVIDVNLLRGRVRVRLEDSIETTIKTFDASEVEVLGGKAKRAEYLALKAEGKGDPIQPRRSIEVRAFSEPKVSADRAEKAERPVRTPERTSETAAPEQTAERQNGERPSGQPSGNYHRRGRGGFSKPQQTQSSGTAPEQPKKPAQLTPGQGGGQQRRYKRRSGPHKPRGDAPGGHGQE